MAISKSDTTVQHSLLSPTWRITRRVHTYTVRRRFCHLYLSRSRSPYLLLSLSTYTGAGLSLSLSLGRSTSTGPSTSTIILPCSSRLGLTTSYLQLLSLSLCRSRSFLTGGWPSVVSPLTFTDSLSS